MGIKIYKPTTPARRQTSVLTSDGIDRKKPEKRLTVGVKKMSGRNNQGKITVRHQGGGAKKKIRLIDYHREKFDVPAKVTAIEYDPNRNSRIALISYRDGEKRYIIAPDGLKAGATVMSSKKLIEFNIGNHLPLKLMPLGLTVHNIELSPGQGGQLCRGAGGGATLMAADNGLVQLKLPSSEIRLVPENSMATIGAVSNADFKNIRWGKAGRMRHRGIRPTVRGKAMNPVDHPHGGGEGHNPIGLKAPKTPWGKPALGVKTRKEFKKSNRFILRRRLSKKRK